MFKDGFIQHRCVHPWSKAKAFVNSGSLKPFPRPHSGEITAQRGKPLCLSAGEPGLHGVMA